MEASNVRQSGGAKNTTAERTSDRELVVTRTFNAAARTVFEAWTKPELMRQWWVPKSAGVNLIKCEMDVRVGGGYRFVFLVGDNKEMAFFGKYLEVQPFSRIVWTNEEDGHGNTITTVTFEEKGGKTYLVMHDLYPSKEALDAAIASGSTAGGMSEQFEQLDQVLVALAQRS